MYTFVWVFTLKNLIVLVYVHLLLETSVISVNFPFGPLESR
jgi:hypothetical protein